MCVVPDTALVEVIILSSSVSLLMAIVVGHSEVGGLMRLVRLVQARLGFLRSVGL